MQKQPSLFAQFTEHRLVCCTIDQLIKPPIKISFETGLAGIECTIVHEGDSSRGAAVLLEMLPIKILGSQISENVFQHRLY